MTEHVIAFPARRPHRGRRARLAPVRHQSSRTSSFLHGIASGVAIGVPASVVTGVGVVAQELMLLVAVLPLLALSAARDARRRRRRPARGIHDSGSARRAA